ncbi:MAG: response regulator [Chlamydiia bacterium]|nr:response regulator [Chlamydiia bacterium]
MTNDELRFGIIVDDFVDSEEIVVKPLGHHVQRCSYYCGATIRGDGSVSLILNILGLSQELKLNKEQQNALLDARVTPESEEEGLLVLTIRSGGQEYYGIPMGIVRRIERVNRSAIEKRAGTLALRHGEKHIPVVTLEEIEVGDPLQAETLYVFVFLVGGKEIGLVGTEVIDTLDVGSNIDDRTFTRPGIIGSAVLGKRTILILDVFQLLGDHGAEMEEQLAEGEIAKNVLVVDDSRFYRTQVARFVKEAGATVHTAEDGLDALRVLEECKNEIDLILTDIEMPKMDGLTFIREVRKDRSMDPVPIVAVTSLTGGTIERDIIDAGASKYMVKLAKDEIIGVLSEHRRKQRQEVKK